MTIYKGESKMEAEKIILSEYNDTERLHKLFKEKGFTKYTDEELSVNREEAIPKHFSHLDKDKSPLEVNKARENFKTAKEKMKKLKNARDNFMMGECLHTTINKCLRSCYLCFCDVHFLITHLLGLSWSITKSDASYVAP